MKVLELTKAQQKKFDQLCEVYNQLKDMGVDFYNLYGTLHPYQKKYIDSINDEGIGYAINDGELVFLNHLEIESQWTDDQHYIQFTKTGESLYKKELKEIY
jgi:hypothetical protein